MKIKVKITKIHVFAFISALLLISGILMINAYNSEWQTIPRDPAVAGHTPDEIYVYWDRIIGVPSGFADGVDNEGLSACSSGQVRIGTGCYALPSCSSSQALRWTGSSFTCVSV